ncbi:MAG: UDP-N-acetylmuramoyl-tripeptide--D-alanyl-D-alanine ligase [Desulfobacterales bacterium]|nr:UDP-N-acetylmuramoyl-tripeptide--D-alanyl-D-alanine ligase [Desulfobacterales bacterium]
MTWTVKDILDATHGEFVTGVYDHRFDSIGIDSRTITPRDAFVAIHGDVHDGHRFIGDVLNQGIRGIVLCRDRVGDVRTQVQMHADAVCVAVEDTTHALGELGGFHRRRSPAAVVAITGSNGKTSTRRMAVEVLSQRFTVLEPAKNLNNQIGVPLTLLRLEPRHQWAVLELGTNRPGEIARLSAICTPDIGVITNIGPAHLEGLGSLEGVLKEKSALLAGLAPGGRAVLNADDPHLQPLAKIAGAGSLLFGLSADAAVRADHIRETDRGVLFELALPERRTAVQLQAFGRFMVHNALAAAAVGYALGLDIADIRQGLEAFTPVAGRMSMIALAEGVHLIDDTYNANPASVEVAIAALDRLRSGSRSLLVLGDMRELGRDAGELHRQVGRAAARSGAAKLLACGDFAADVAAGARQGGMATADITTGSRSDVLAALLLALRAGDWVLVKGSRAMGMEAIVRAVQDWSAQRN